MRKKLQDKMFEISYIIELIISLIVGLSIVVVGANMVLDVFGMITKTSGMELLMKILDDAITLAIGAELIKMLCKHTPETVIEVLAFALSRQLIVGHAGPLENLITIVAIALLFAIRKFLLKSHDMVETPDGLIENKKVKEAEFLHSEI